MNTSIVPILKLRKYRFIDVGLKFVDIDSKPAPFMQGDLGKDSCPEGYEAITDASTCQTASESLGLEYAADQNSDNINAICNWCGGCSPQSTRLDEKHWGQARWICQLQGIRMQWLVICYLTKQIFHEF